MGLKIKPSQFETTRFSNNVIPLLGAGLSLMRLTMIVVLFLMNMVFDMRNTYIGIYIYIILPVFLVLGLIMIHVGMVIHRK